MSLTGELAALESMSIGALRSRWRLVRLMEPPPNLSTRLLQSTLIYDLQAKRFGGLPQAAERKLIRIAARLERNPNASALEDEKPAPGAKLIREWGSERHEVEVLNEGFAYRGNIYGSLSEIARAITGLAGQARVFLA